MVDSLYPTPEKYEAIRFSGREEAKDLVLKMAKQAQKQICIQGIHIDQALFDNEPFIEQLRQLALKSSKTKIRILVHETVINVQNDHRLIALAQHLSSSIFIHNTAKQHRDNQHTLLLVDDFAYLMCPRATVYEGMAHFYDRMEVRHLQRRFDLCWEHSTPDISIRRLHL